MEVKFGVRETNSSSAHALILGKSFPHVSLPQMVNNINGIHLSDIIKKRGSFDEDYASIDYDDGELVLHSPIKDKDILLLYMFITARDNLSGDELSFVIHQLKKRGLILDETHIKYIEENETYIAPEAEIVVSGRKAEFFTFLLAYSIISKDISLFVVSDDITLEQLVNEHDIDIFSAFLFSNRSFTVYRPEPDTFLLLSDYTPDKIIVKDPFISDIPYYNPSYPYRYYPHLIDTLISLRCSHNCPYCYIGARLKGKTAQVTDLIEFVKYIPLYSVGEIAIGGGNLIETPDLLVAACDIFSSTGSKLSLTIRATDLKNKKSRDLLDYVGEKYKYKISLGITVETLNDVELYHKYKSEIPYSLHNVLHFINGVSDPDILQMGIYDNILILGYKETAYNESYKSTKRFLNLDDILSFKDRQYVSNYIRRPLLLFDDLAIQQIGVGPGIVGEFNWNLTYLGPEGARSLFINFIEKKCGPNSYQHDKMKSYHDALDIFETFDHNYRQHFGIAKDDRKNSKEN